MRYRVLKHNAWAIYSLGLFFLLLLLGLDYLSAQNLFTPLYNELGISPPKGHSLVGATTASGVAVLISAYAVLPRLSDMYMLLSKATTALAVSLCLTGLVALQYPLSIGVGLSFLLLPIGFGNFCASYQRSNEVHIYLRLGLILFVLSLLDARMLLLLPLFIYSGTLVGSLGFRPLGALITGLISPSILLIAYLVYALQWSGMLTLVEIWLRPLWQIEFLLGAEVLQSNWDLLLLCILSFISALSYKAGRSTESVRQRRQGSILVAWTIYSMGLLQFYPSPMLAVANLLATSFLGARAFSLLDAKPYKIALGISAIVLSLVTLLI